VSVPASVAVGTVLSFTLALRDTYGSTFTATFEITTGAIDQNFSVTQVALQKDTNGDNKLSPGESADLRIELRNDGTSKALGMTGDLTSSNAAITITGGKGLKFGDLGPTASACASLATSSYPGNCSASYFPSVSVPASVAAGTVLPFTLALRDTYGNTFTATFQLTLTN
jgi:hypothetical protein